MLPGQKRAGDQALGRSRGGWSTKIHLAFRGLGCPVRVVLTAGQRGDSPKAAALLDKDRPGFVLAGTAHDADHFRAAVAEAAQSVCLKMEP